MATPLEHYGLIGDTTTIALISKAGSLDWLCLPRIDSDACFAKLLGRNEHGYWAIRPSTEVRASSHRYRPDTLILETEFACEGGRVRIIDFMPPGIGAEHDIIRIVEGLEGTVPMHADLKARFAYGHLIPWIHHDGHRATMTSGPDTLALESPVALKPDFAGARIEADFMVRAGDRKAFTLVFYPSHSPKDGAPVHAEKELTRTERFWRDWAAKCRYQGPYRDAVLRSLITLKALTQAETGGIVAAPTCGLPEELGGVRNWDYRYCWLRDSTLTLDALMLDGYDEEARAWMQWLLRAVAGAPAEAQIMYGVGGEHRLTEVELPWLPGYEESAPVRIGNGAYDQFQLDIYGETLNTLYEARMSGIELDKPVPWDQLMIATPVLTRRIQGFEFNAAHFAERHGALILIVFGESLLAVGLAARTRKVDVGLVLGALAGLAATAAMWWAYFVGDDRRGAQAFQAAPPRRRVIQVLVGYELATAVMIFGVIAVAAGTRLRVLMMMSPTPAFEARLIAEGAMLFLFGSAGFRLAMGFGSWFPRVLGAVLCLVAVPASERISEAAGLAAIALVITATLLAEHFYEARPARALHRGDREVRR
jgi:hypothetical protein